MTFLQIWVMRPARYLCAWHNSMARRTDRIENAIALILLVLFGLSFPLASWAAESVYHTVSAHAHTQSATGTYTDAVLLEDVPGGGIGAAPWAKARWTARDGTRRVELIPATAGASAGAPDSLTAVSNISRAAVGAFIGVAVAALNEGATNLVVSLSASRPRLARATTSRLNASKRDGVHAISASTAVAVDAAVAAAAAAAAVDTNASGT